MRRVRGQSRAGRSGGGVSHREVVEALRPAQGHQALAARAGVGPVKVRKAVGLLNLLKAQLPGHDAQHAAVRRRRGDWWATGGPSVTG